MRNRFVLGYITDTLQHFKSTGKSIDPIAMMVVEYLSSKVFQIQIPTDFRGLIKWSPDEFLALSGFPKPRGEVPKHSPWGAWEGAEP